MRYLSIIIVLAFTTMFSLNAATYYWVGGSGNWSDISHWVTTSGGVVNHTQSPTADDDVIFDFNSFNAPGQTLTLNTDIVFCRSMTWSGVSNNPTLLAAESVRLNIYGSLLLDPNIDFNFDGRITFTGNLLDNTVSFGIHHAGQDITFDGSGAWTLNSAITVDSTFILNEGSLLTNGQNIDCKYFESSTTNTRRLELGSTIITIQGQTIDPFNGNVPDQIIQPLRLHATNLTLIPSSSLIVLTNPLVDIWFEGPGNLDFNRLILSSFTGNSRILPYDDISNESNFPTVHINELNLFHNTTLYGSMGIDNLLLHEGHRYQFESGKTFVFDYIESFGDCSNAIVLSATDTAIPTFFETDDNITLSFTNIQAITGQGSGAFTANNAIDLGNNSGWTINPRTPRDFFWINGTGNWNQTSHWSFTSGGAASGCLPSAQDDVYFDANSFTGPNQIVTINIENAYCRTMDWTGATGTPELAGPQGNNIRPTGSLVFIPDMQHTFIGAYHFESSNLANTITTAGQPFNYDLHFSGADGEWVLQDDVYVDRDILFHSGALNTNGQNVTSNGFHADQPTMRNLTLGNTYFLLELRGDRRPDWRLNAENLIFDSGTSTIETTGGYSNLIQTSGEGTTVYNNIVFSSDEGRLLSLYSNPTSSVIIDSLIFWSEGFFSGDNDINYLYLAPGKRYDLVQDAEQTINELDANGDCAHGLIYIRASNLGHTTTFNISNDHTLDRLHLHGIEQVGAGVLTANNSIDGGGNINWIFNEGGGRTLYWVGDEGDWNQESSWSLSSGGAGGECIPTPIDNVIFDANSFVSAGALVSNGPGGDGYCHDLTWTAGVMGTPQFGLTQANVFGSLLIESPMDWSINATYFLGNENHTITSNGVALMSLVFEGLGTYRLEDALTADVIQQVRGTLNTNSQRIFAGRYIATTGPSTKTLILGDTHMTLNGQNNTIFTMTFTAFSDDIIIEPGTSLIEMTHPDAGLRTITPLNFNNVLFSNAQGDGILNTVASNFNTINFNGNGEIVSSLTTDTLICAPGKSYVFDSNQTQTINEYWQIIGNNCTPIELRASELGVLANASMPASGTVLADFIQMRDIQGLGGADFLAGAGSTDIGNSNVGWTFDTAPELMDIGFLGPDIALCSSDPITLDAYGYSMNETYLWQDGSIDSTFTTDQSGIYSVEVTFETTCVIRDTIEVISGQDFEVSLVDDPEICQGESLTLDADVSIGGATYTWHDGSTDPTFLADAAGEYFVEVSIGGCTDSDTTNVSANTFPTINLGPDLSVCEGDMPTLEANTTADSFEWQDGSMASNFVVNAPGIYWLEAANGTCVFRDSVEVNYITPTSVDLGVDTLICGDPSYDLVANVSGATYLWSDGTDGNSLTVFTDGTYWLEVDLGGCTARDSVEVSFQSIPQPVIPDEIFACEGDVIDVVPGLIADAYLWSDGEMDTMFSTGMAGTYFLDATFGACVSRKYFEIILSPIPVIQGLGPDVDLCEGTTLNLEAQTNVEDITWQDGSMNDNFIVTSAGEYYFIAEANGCTASDTIDVSYTALPALDLGQDLSPCTGDLVNLAANITADVFEWQDSSSGNNITVSTSGVYWLEATNDLCAFRDSVEVTFITPSSIDLGVDTLICDDNQHTLSADISGASYLWNDGSIANSLIVNVAGSYWLEATIGSCIVADTIEISYAASPDLDLGVDQTLCDGQTTTLSSDVAADEFLWQDGSSEDNITVSSSGVYWLEVTSNLCAFRDSIEMTFITPSSIDLGVDTLICGDNEHTLSADISDASYLWSDGSTANSLTVNTAGSYWLEATSGSCAVSDTIEISYAALPDLDLGADQTLCDGETITLSTDVIVDEFLWQDGSVLNSLMVNLPGIYWLEITQGLCAARDSVEVISGMLANLDLGSDTTLCDQQLFVLTPVNEIGTLTWPDGSQGNSFTVETSGLVTAMLDNGGCISRDSVIVNYKECTIFEAYIPNIFSPNDDGVNDTFEPKFNNNLEILSYELNIFDRWGAHVFQTTNPLDGWNGKHRDKLVSEDVYVYSIDIRYRDDFGEKTELLTGDVMVLH